MAEKGIISSSAAEIKELDNYIVLDFAYSVIDEIDSGVDNILEIIEALYLVTDVIQMIESPKIADMSKHWENFFASVGKVAGKVDSSEEELMTPKIFGRFEEYKRQWLMKMKKFRKNELSSSRDLGEIDSTAVDFELHSIESCSDFNGGSCFYESCDMKNLSQREFKDESNSGYSGAMVVSSSRDLKEIDSTAGDFDLYSIESCSDFSGSSDFDESCDKKNLSRREFEYESSSGAINFIVAELDDNVPVEYGYVLPEEWEGNDESGEDANLIIDEDKQNGGNKDEHSDGGNEVKWKSDSNKLDSAIPEDSDVHDSIQSVEEIDLIAQEVAKGNKDFLIQALSNCKNELHRDHKQVLHTGMDSIKDIGDKEFEHVNDTCSRVHEITQQQNAEKPPVTQNISEIEENNLDSDYSEYEIISVDDYSDYEVISSAESSDSDNVNLNE